MTYKMTIGIECHVQLNTKTKLFSLANNDAKDQEPNSCISAIDYALPGMLPILNREAITLAIKAGLALNSEINLISRFDRKHYFYPDLPKGYQISQFYQPIIGAGQITLADGSIIRIEHAHLEEDAGKLTHYSNYSLVDLNRAGTPLLEIVSMPDIHSAFSARLYCEELHRLMTYAGVTLGDLYHGNMRFDINISISPDDNLGTRAEIKNLNSFRSIERAVEYEIKRQTEILEKGERVVQETRGWSDATGRTTSQRSKEQAQDYRYMPEPDLPPIHLDQSLVDSIQNTLPLLPSDYRKSLEKIIPKDTLEVLLDYQSLTEKLYKVFLASTPVTTQKISNLFSSVLLAEENQNLLNAPPPSTENLVELATMSINNELSSTSTKQIFLEFFDPKNSDKSSRALAGELNLLQENDTSALDAIIDQVLVLPECVTAVADIKSGELKAIGFLVGQVMKRSAGKANPSVVQQLLRTKLS